MKKKLILLKQSHKNCHSKTLVFRKLSLSSEMQNAALMHREDLNNKLSKYEYYYPLEVAGCANETQLQVRKKLNG